MVMRAFLQCFVSRAAWVRCMFRGMSVRITYIFSIYSVRLEVATWLLVQVVGCLSGCSALLCCV